MANDQKTTPSESPPPTPRRASAAAERAATSRRRWIIGGLLSLLVLGAGVVLVRDGDGALGSLPGGDEGRETPEFAFDVRKTTAEPTTGTPPSRLQGAAKSAGNEVRVTLDALYAAGFVDPDTWGEFDAIEDLFVGSARAQAEADIEVLTLGPDADTVEFVDPKPGKVIVRVLMDTSDEPMMAIATVKFTATAERDDGTLTTVRSTGSYYLQPGDGAWEITGYRVDRSDEPTDGPQASGSGSSSPESAP